MLAKRIIPCLDVKDGRTVKGVNFENLRDAGDIVELATAYSARGADELVFLDISATDQRRRTMLDWVERVAGAINIPFTVGGGISCEDDVNALLRRGADKVSVNSAAVHNPGLITRLADTFGSQCVVVAADARKHPDGTWMVYTRGGKDLTDRELFSWCSEAERRGAGEILFTSMDNDGTRAGFANDALARLSDTLSIPVIASGGAGGPADFLDAFTLGHADAALAAGIFHFGRTSVGEVKKYLQQHGIEVRL